MRSTNTRVAHFCRYFKLLKALHVIKKGAKLLKRLFLLLVHHNYKSFNEKRFALVQFVSIESKSIIEYLNRKRELVLFTCSLSDHSTKSPTIVLSDNPAATSSAMQWTWHNSNSGWRPPRQRSHAAASRPHNWFIVACHLTWSHENNLGRDAAPAGETRQAQPMTELLSCFRV